MTFTEKQTQIETKEAEIRCLTSALSASNSDIGDWKIIKCYEAKLLDKDLPYALDSLMQAREEARTKINELQAEIAELEATEAEPDEIEVTE